MVQNQLCFIAGIIMNFGIGTPLAIVLTLFTSLRMAGIYWASITLISIEVALLNVTLIFKWKTIFPYSQLSNQENN